LLKELYQQTLRLLHSICTTRNSIISTKYLWSWTQ